MGVSDLELGDEVSGVEESTRRRNEGRREKRALSVFTLSTDFILFIFLNGIANVCHPSWVKGWTETVRDVHPHRDRGDEASAHQTTTRRKRAPTLAGRPSRMRSKRSDQGEIGPTEEGLYFIQRSVRSIRPGGYRLDFFGSFCVTTKECILCMPVAFVLPSRIANECQPS